MGDRFGGTCGKCQGRGEIKIRDSILLTETAQECGRCGGTGESGSAQHYLAKEQETEHRINPAPEYDDWRK